MGLAFFVIGIPSAEALGFVRSPRWGVENNDFDFREFVEPNSRAFVRSA
jgi:hypothetical protein